MANGIGVAPSISRVYLAADVPLIEKGLPAHLLYLACEDLQKKGWEMRSDVLHHLNLAARAALAKQDPMTVQRCAKAIDEAAQEMLHGASPDDPRDAVLACCSWLLHLVEEGLFPDTGNSAVLAALHVMEDAREDPAWGMNAVWLSNTAKSMLRTANMRGLYAKTIDPATVH
jgi:hypothetical protein